MHAPTLSSFNSVALAARASRTSLKCLATGSFTRPRTGSTPCRRFHASPRRDEPTPPNTPRSTNDSALQDDQPGASQASSESMGWRARNAASGGRKRIQAKRKATSDLPPFDIPDSFLNDNVQFYSEYEKPKLPRPLEKDKEFPKVSGLHLMNSPHDRQRIEAYFTEALEHFDLRTHSPGPNSRRHRWNNKVTELEHQIAAVDAWIECAWHLTDALYPAREAEYTYYSRPWWWWSIQKDRDATASQEAYPFGARQQPMEDVIWDQYPYSISHGLPDLPGKLCDGFTKMVDRDLETIAPDTFDPKTGKRPINIFSVQGHAGKSVAESLGRYVGWGSNADVIHIDAFDISWMLGRYIGQDWLYARGPVSTLGFRAAELAGRLGKFMVTETRKNDDEDDGQVFHVRSAADLRRLRSEIEDDVSDSVSSVTSSGNAVFSDWENLKIKKALDAIISEPVRGVDSPVIIHVHDYIEMSMTLEGSAILSMLRKRIDTAWADGKKIVMMGTSSCKTPSEEYNNMIKELSTSEIVASRVVAPDSFPEPAHPGHPNRFNLELFDQLCENARNVNRMVMSIDPNMESSSNLWDPYDMDSDYWQNPIRYQPTAGYSSPPSLKKNFYTSATLPWTECYSVAKSWLANAEPWASDGPGLAERAQMGPLIQQGGRSQPMVIDLGSMGPNPGNGGGPDIQSLFDQVHQQHSHSEQHRHHERQAPNVDLKNANEYEKRIAGGVIQRDSLRTTFADVHVPPETKSSLKLLTSLALVRPDAFSYGILALDKINGCLLYGPPGTGKTMLAKAVAKDSGANMLEVSGASIHDKWVGESEKLIKAVFSLAKKLSPCVIFIDEGDAILGKRSTDSSRGSHRETLNQFLKEWDGMEETNAFIMVATNRPFDLDEAVLRRLPRKLLIDLPLRDDRAAILKLLLRDEQVASDVDFHDFANRTPFYSGSDIKNLCVSAAMTAVEEENAAKEAHTGSEPYEYPEKRTLQKTHFEKALKQIPASISEDMDTLKMIKKFDAEYGKGRKGGAKKSMGFGNAKPAKTVDVDAAARVRSGDQPETGP